MADGRRFTNWYKRTRKRTLDAIKAGERENPLPVPADKLPAE